MLSWLTGCWLVVAAQHRVPAQISIKKLIVWKSPFRSEGGVFWQGQIWIFYTEIEPWERFGMGHLELLVWCQNLDGENAQYLLLPYPPVLVPWACSTFPPARCLCRLQIVYPYHFPRDFCLTQAEQVSLIVFPYHPLIYSVSTGLCYQVIPSRVWASGDSIGPILVPQGLSSVSHIGDVHGVAVLMTGWMNERVSQGRQRCGDVWRLGEAMCKQLWVCFSG